VDSNSRPEIYEFDVLTWSHTTSLTDSECDQRLTTNALKHLISQLEEFYKLTNQRMF